MTRQEKSLLLYLETRAVDHAGLIDVQRVNDEDLETMNAWNKEGYVLSGRVKFKFIRGHNSMWCHLSKKAFVDAHSEREVRADKAWSNKRYQTTRLVKEDV